MMTLLFYEVKFKEHYVCRPRGVAVCEKVGAMSCVFIKIKLFPVAFIIDVTCFIICLWGIGMGGARAGQGGIGVFGRGCIGVAEEQPSSVRTMSGRYILDFIIFVACASDIHV